MKSGFITGANKGIGFETAKQLLLNGFYVYLGSRNYENGTKALEKLKAEKLTNVEIIEIDVNDSDSVKNARIEIEKKTNCLDVLINNAGINGGATYSALEASSEQFFAAFNTNVFGVARVIKEFIDLLRKSPEP